MLSIFFKSTLSIHLFNNKIYIAVVRVLRKHNIQLIETTILYARSNLLVNFLMYQQKNMT